MRRIVANLYRGFGPSSGTPPATPPATPALSQPADKADGTGATATISGSTAGSANTVYTAPWTGAGGNLTWTASATRTGDGAVSLSLSNGFYLVYCESVLAGLPSLPSNFPAFQTTGGTTYAAVHKALAEKVKTQIQGMLGNSIIGPVADSVRVRKVPSTIDFGSIDPDTLLLPVGSDKKHAWPAILVCYFDLETLNPLAGTNIRDDIGYPLAILMMQPNNTANTVASEDGDDTMLRWREVLERTFTHLRGVQSTAGKNGFLDVTANAVNYTFHDCTAKPGSIFDWNRWKSPGGNFDYGWLVFNFIVRRPGLV